MSPESVVHALSERSEERDRISGDLLDLEAHTSFQLLKSTELGGETERRWAEAEAAMRTLWSLFDAYRSTLERVEDIVARNPKLNGIARVELTTLLTGPSVLLRAEPKPVEQRSLCPPADESLTLDEAVHGMDVVFRGTVEIIRDVDAVWTILLPKLTQAESTLLATVDRHARLVDADRATPPAAPHPALAKLGRKLTQLREAVIRDPLGVGSADEDLDRVSADLTVYLHHLEELHAFRETYDERRASLLERVERLRADEDKAREIHARVVMKIAAPVPPVLQPAADALLDELAMLDSPGIEWPERARRLALLDHAVGEAVEQASAASAGLLGLLGRRDELRGQLGAYQAKAVRLNRASDPAAVRSYQRARLLLWSAPCELPKAASAVMDYRRAINGGNR